MSFKKLALLTVALTLCVAPVACATEVDNTDATLAVKQEDVAPKAVKSLKTCAVGKTQMKLTWKKAKGADFYVVARSDSDGKNYKELAEVKKPKYTDKTVVYGKSYVYYVTPINSVDVRVPVVDEVTILTQDETVVEMLDEQVPVVDETPVQPDEPIESVEPEEPKEPEYTIETVLLSGPEKKIIFSNKKVVATDHQKYSFAEMENDIKALKKKYNGLVDYSVIGESRDGREIYDVVLGNPDAEKSFLVVATLHAREYMCSMLTMNQIEYYLENYNSTLGGYKPSDVFDKVQVHVVAMANPDGVTISQFGFDAMDDSSIQTAVKKLGGYAPTWKANAAGVDLNRNFPYNFKVREKAGSSGYSGPYAMSEPEVRAVVDLTNQLNEETNLQAVLNYHAMGSIIFGDTDGSKSWVATMTRKMYSAALKETKYSSAAAYSASTGPSYGNAREYFMDEIKVPSITIEIGRVACPLPISQWSPVWNANKNVMLQQVGLFK